MWTTRLFTSLVLFDFLIMTLGSPSTSCAERFVYSVSADVDRDNADLHEYKDPLPDVANAGGNGESMYVTLFEGT